MRKRNTPCVANHELLLCLSSHWFPTEGFNTFNLKGDQWKLRSVHMLIKFTVIQNQFILKLRLNPTPLLTMQIILNFKGLRDRVHIHRLRPLEQTSCSTQLYLAEKGTANLALVESRNLSPRILLPLLPHRILHDWFLRSAVISCNWTLRRQTRRGTESQTQMINRGFG